MINKALVFIGALLFFGLVCADTPADILEETRTKLYNLCNEGSYIEALPVSEAMIELLSVKYGADSFKLAAPYHNKAIIEQSLNDYARAALSYEESARLIRKNKGRYSLRLVNLLIDHGSLYYETGENELALDKFREAQHIVHRNGGIYSLTQLDAMDWISATIRRGGKFSALDAQEKFYYKINEQNYPDGDLRILPARQRLGKWLKDSAQYSEAIRLHKDTLALIRAADEEEYYRAIPVLYEMSSIAYLSNRCCRGKPLEEVLNILQRETVGDVEDLITATLRLADMRLLSREIEGAKDLYQQAWVLRSGTPNAERRGEKEFGHPIQLGYGNILDGVEVYDSVRRGGITPLGLTTYYIERSDTMGTSVNFDFGETKRRQRMIGGPVFMCYLQVREFLPTGGDMKLDTYYMDIGVSIKQNGHVANIKVKDSNTPGKLSMYVKKLLRKIRYRPKMKNGSPVISELAVRQTFNDVDLYALNNNSVFPDRVAGASQICKILAEFR